LARPAKRLGSGVCQEV